jgi:hypothetical protein
VCDLVLEINYVRWFVQSMPEAAGAVAAAAVADRLLGAKERRQLAIVLVSFNHMVGEGRSQLRPNLQTTWQLRLMHYQV